MIKGKNYGVYSCIGKSGKPKSAWNTQDEVISEAKRLNAKNNFKTSKLVGYKCTHCFKYHLTTVQIKPK